MIRRLLFLLIAAAPLAGCDAADAVEGTAVAAAALPGSDTLLTTRRVFVGDPANRILGLSTIMPDGGGLASTDWGTGNPAILDLATNEWRVFRINGEAYDSGHAELAVPSPDGERIAFQWFDRNADYQLRVLSVETGRSRMVLDSVSYPVPAVWVGDTIVAWIARESGVREIAMVPAEGGERRTVYTMDAHAARGLWRMHGSPDGRFLAFDYVPAEEEYRADIHVVDLRTGAIHPLVEGPAHDVVYAWMPGVNTVLFTSDRGGTDGLWAVRVADGRAAGEPMLVRPDFFRTESLGLDDDGGLLYVVSTGGREPHVANLDPAGGAVLGAPIAGQERLDRLVDAAWSPDGSAVAYLEDSNRSKFVRVRSLGTGQMREYPIEPGFDRALEVGWSPDGMSLLLRAGEFGAGGWGLYRLNLASGNLEEVFPPEGGAYEFNFFDALPGGESILMRRRRTLPDGRNEVELLVRDLRNRTDVSVHVLAGGFIAGAGIAPDGRTAAWVERQHLPGTTECCVPGADTVFIRPVDGSSAARAVGTGDGLLLVDWLPDGEALLLTRAPGEREAVEDGPELVRLDLDGRFTTVGALPRGASVLRLSPQGDRLAFIAGELGEELWRMDGLRELLAGAPGGQ